MIQGNFKKRNQITVGGLSHVPSQPAEIPTSRSMPSRDKRLLFDTWNTCGSQENVFLVSNFCTFDSSRNHHEGIHYCTTPRETGSVQQAAGTGTSFAGDEERNRGAIPMPTFARRPSLLPVEFPQMLWLDSKRQQISELQFDKSPDTQSILGLEDEIQKPSDHLF